MHPTLARFLVRLYPRPWRRRYGPEFQALLETHPAGPRACLDVAWSALRERTCLLAPWAVFGVGPVVLLALAYLLALLTLWAGWHIFLPGAASPFNVRATGFANLVFQADRAFYYAAPFLIGWTLAIAAARERVAALWPALGFIALTLASTTNRVHATGGAVGMAFAPLAGLAGVLDAALVLTVIALPYLLWRLRKVFHAGSLF